MYEAIFVEPWPWWAGGVALGLFTALYAWIYNKRIGASGAFENALREWNRPLIRKPEAQMSLDEAAWKLALDQGLDPKALGLTAPVAKGPVATKEFIEMNPRVFLPGILVGALIGALIAGSETTFAPGLGFGELFPIGTVGQSLVLLVGGIFAGLGARLAGGCPSGHGLGGLSTFEASSFLAVAGYFTSGIALTFLLRALV